MTLNSSPVDFEPDSHFFYGPVVFSGVLLGVLLILAVLSKYLLVPDLVIIPLAYMTAGSIPVFSVWHGYRMTRIDLLQQWRRHALGDISTLSEFRWHRWLWFSTLDFVAVLIVFSMSACLIGSVLSKIFSEPSGY